MFKTIKKRINLPKVNLAKLWSRTEHDVGSAIEKSNDKSIAESPLQELDDLIFSYLLPEDLAKVDLVCRQCAIYNQKHWRNHLITIFHMRPGEVAKLPDPRLTYAEQINKLPFYFVIGNQRIQRKPFDDPFKFEVRPIKDSFPSDKFYLYLKFEQAQAEQKKLIADVPKAHIKYYKTTYPLFKVKLKKPLKENTASTYAVDRKEILEFTSIDQNHRLRWF